MDSLKSKVAYLQGLADGMDLPLENKEGRLLNGIISVLQDVAEELEGLGEAQEQLEDYVETIDEDLYTLEEDLGGCDCEGEDYVEVECPGCGETVMFESDILEDDDVIEVTCPNCDEVVFVNEDEAESLENKEGGRKL